MGKPKFNRAEEDFGNVLNMEHINLTVPDQQLAALFYVTGLGFTRDPYIDFGTFNMWINVGEQQFHLPKRDAQRFRGRIGVVVPELEGLKRRLGFIERPMQGTDFSWREEDDHIALTCPWGNRIDAYGPSFGTSLGIPFARIDAPPGSAAGIARFYTDVLDTPARVVANGHTQAEVSMGASQRLIFRETEAEIPAYDGHHIAIYIANFSGPHAKLAEHGLISEESDQHQYRFQTIVDPTTGETLTEIEHEVRSLKHPMFKRNLVNRNPAQSFGNYRHGHDAFVPVA